MKTYTLSSLQRKEIEERTLSIIQSTEHLLSLEKFTKDDIANVMDSLLRMDWVLRDLQIQSKGADHIEWGKM